MSQTADIITHHAAFEKPLQDATTRADWLLGKWRKRGGLQAALAFDRAAEEQQMLAYREDASRRYRGLPAK